MVRYIARVTETRCRRRAVHGLSGVGVDRGDHRDAFLSRWRDADGQSDRPAEDLPQCLDEGGTQPLLELDTSEVARNGDDRGVLDEGEGSRLHEERALLGTDLGTVQRGQSGPPCKAEVADRLVSHAVSPLSLFRHRR
jgi:hypothetical protein